MFKCDFCGKLWKHVGRYAGVSCTTLVFLAMVGTFLAMEVVGLYSTAKLKMYFEDIAYNHAVGLQHIEQVRRSFQRIRYCEKDLFIHVGNTAKVEHYKAEWDKSLIEIDNCIKVLTALPHDSMTEEIHSELYSLRDTSVYEAGMNTIVQGIREGKITTPKQADDAIQISKWNIKAADGTALAVQKKYEARLNAAVKESVKGSAFIQKLLVVLSGVGFIIAVVLTAVLIRSIGKENVSDRRKSHVLE